MARPVELQLLVSWLSDGWSNWILPPPNPCGTNIKVEIVLSCCRVVAPSGCSMIVCLEHSKSHLYTGCLHSCLKKELVKKVDLGLKVIKIRAVDRYCPSLETSTKQEEARGVFFSSSFSNLLTLCSHTGQTQQDSCCL